VSELSISNAFDGEVLFKGDPKYEAARLDALWNGRKTSRMPAAILLARSEADVSRGVLLATERRLRIGIRSGGHSWIGNGIRDNVLLIDLSALDEVVIDSQNQTAQVQPAARGSDLNAILSEHDLVFPTGHCPSVGMGGYLLGGGYGWNSRALGPACMSITAIDVVLADGTLIHADDESHPDLMWAARGSGPGFFGIITRFHLTLHRAYTEVRLSTYLFPEDMRDEVLAWSHAILSKTSPSLELSVKIAYTPGSSRPTCRLVAVAFCTTDEGPAMLEPIESAPFLDRAIHRIERSVTSLQELYDRSEITMPKGLRYAVDGIWTSSPAEDVIGAGRHIMDNLPSRESFLFWMLWGNYPEQPNACWSTQAQLYFSPNALWHEPADDFECETWAHAALQEFDGIGAGTQFADANPGDRPDRGMESAQSHRLESLRGVYDPEGRFCSYLNPDESTTTLGLSIQASRS
jgi:FAD/FMN-containing dehydrogenase